MAPHTITPGKPAKLSDFYRFGSNDGSDSRPRGYLPPSAGLSTCQCRTCSEVFTGYAAFDAHRTGSHARDTRHCLPPESVGLADAQRDYVCWGFPQTDQRWKTGAAA